jgi:hypothetical protein
MKKLELPTEDDCTIEVSLNGRTFNVDVMDIQQLIWAAGEEAERAQQASNWRAFFVDLFDKEYDLVLTQTQAHFLMDTATDILADLKKKFSLSQELPDSMDAP